MRKPVISSFDGAEESARIGRVARSPAQNGEGGIRKRLKGTVDFRGRRRALGWALALSPLAIPAVALAFRPAPVPDAWVLLWLFALAPALALAATEGWVGVIGATFAGTLLTILGEWLVRSARGEGAEPAVVGAVILAAWMIAIGIGGLAARLRSRGSEAARLAYTDDLTGLPNRRWARVCLEREFAAARRGRELAVVIFDLDEFKEYNDRHGHLAGDDALRSVASLLQAQTRQMNVVARFGGEEFICILSGCGVDGAALFAERIRLAMRACPNLSSPLSVSAGVAAFEPSMSTPPELVTAADEALYAAKGGGRDRVQVYGEVEARRPLQLDAEGESLYCRAASPVPSSC